MKKIISSIVLSFLIVCTSFFQVKAQDGVFGNPQSLGHKQFSLGIQPIIYTQLGSDEFMLMVRGAYGVRPDVSLHGKLGVLRNEIYFGGHLEYKLAREPYEPISFTLLGGVHGFGEPGLKFGGILSKQISEFSLYSGLTFEPLFTDEVLMPLLLPLGIDIPVSGEQTNFVFEANLGLNDDANLYEAVHFGVNFYF